LAATGGGVAWGSPPKYSGMRGTVGQKREAAVAEERAKFFECPECHEHFQTPEGLGSHLERHREVLPAAPPSPRGKPRSLPCPRDCGRHFPLKEKREYTAHVALCDGSAPIAAVIEEERKEEPVAKLECPKCGKRYLRGGSKYEKHVEECDEKDTSAGAGGGDAEPAARPAAAAISPEKDGTVKDQVLSMLEGLEEHFEGKLKQVKVLISAVRNASEVEG
jgi:uncharacterized C2H2 Zn-finger protein